MTGVIINMVAEDWINSKSEQDRNMIIKRAQIPRFGLLMRVTTNITDPGRPMLMQTYYIYDITKTPQYELTFIVQAVYIMLAMMSYTGVDNFHGLLVFHICGQLDILKNCLRHLDTYINSQDMLKSCIAKHIRILRLISIRHIAISLFDDGNDLSITHLVFFLSNILNIFAHMCLYCALGEILIAQCNGIYSAAYNNEWFLVDPKIAKDLLLLIRGTKPVYLTAGKIFPMTMATFCGLVKTSAGYISVLHTTRS
ncbi:odorant receptor 43a-like [Linepithema humile]|uniref:odorant receptor 43a-like n=1 Tax=Linepithema humile TaxID=83485 RepID=UPI00351E8F34